MTQIISCIILLSQQNMTFKIVTQMILHSHRDLVLLIPTVIRFQANIVQPHQQVTQGPLLHGQVITTIINYGINSLIYSKTLMVHPSKFGNG